VGKRKLVRDFLWKNLKERYRLENVVLERMILKWVKKIRMGHELNSSGSG
jgi:hypothetical protein